MYNISSIIKNEILKMNNWNNEKRINYLSNLKTIKILKNSNNNFGVYLLSNYIVAKQLNYNSQGFILWKNEINSLKKVLGIPYFPQLIAINPKNLTIYMTYCGKNLLENSNLPTNWKQQIETIKKILLKKMLNPNDILPRNICILDNTIKIIDFGLANMNPNQLYKSLNKLDNLIINFVRYSYIN